MIPSNDWPAMAEALHPEIQNLIGGRRSHPEGAKRIEKYGPRDGLLLYSFGSGSAEDVELAVSSARRAFVGGQWSRESPAWRKQILLRLCDLIEARKDEFALLESLDVGKPIRDARAIDIPMAISALRYSAEAAEKLLGKVYTAGSSHLCWQLRRPIGVVAGIVGWNFPLVLAASKIGPALAAGNSFVLKPSELTSLATVRLAELALEAGVPEGVFNVIHGDGDVGAALARHADVDLVTFTGSTATGRRLLVASGQSNMKRLVLECGGKAANIVFDDCPDPQRAADAIVARAFWNNGQVCTASSRLLVQQGIKDELLRLVTERVSSLKVGDPLEESSEFGSLVSAEHRAKVQNYISVGAEEGARVAFQSDEQVPFAGGFYSPRVLFDSVMPHHRVAREEIFGPVLSVLSFEDEAQAVGIANDTIYGLSAIMWTTNFGRVQRVVHQLDVGVVTINMSTTPSSVMATGALEVEPHKQSGFGVEGGEVGLHHYTVSTAVQINC